MKTILILLILLVLGLQYHLWFGDDGLVHAWRIKREIEVQEVKNAKVTKQNGDLSAEIDFLKNNKSSIENRARNDLGMVKEGEVFYQIVK